MRSSLFLAATSLFRLFVAASEDKLDSSEVICHGETCYASVFEPTDVFTPVHSDQIIPAGLHVRINMETGLKEAKLLLPEDMESQDASDLALVPGEEAKEAIIPVASQTPEPYPPSRPLPGSDFALFDHAIKSLQSSEICTVEIQQALDTLEELAHELEFGLRTIDQRKSNGLETLLRLLQHSSDAQCRAKAAMVLGSALRNNANAVLALPEAFPLTAQLIRLLQAEDEGNTQKMIMYALSAAMAQRTAKEEYHMLNGHEILLKAYSSGSDDLKGKIASFIEDHFSQANGPENGVTLQDSKAYENGLVESEALGNWCYRFQESLMGPITSITCREKLLSAASQIRRTNANACTVSKEFLNYLAEVSSSDQASEAIVAMARSARPLFGNTKASRKHQAGYL